MQDTKQQLTAKDWTAPLGNGGVLLPIFALLGGLWAFGTPIESEHLTKLMIALALVLGGWCPFWWTLVHTNWAECLVVWQTWNHCDTLPRWPYLQAKTPGAALHHTLSLAHTWWKQIGRENLGNPLKRAALSLLVSVLLAIALGRTILLLSLLFITWTEIMVLWRGEQKQVSAGGSAIALVGLPWLLGASLSNGEVALAFPSALAIVILTGLYMTPSALAVGGPLLMALFLIWQMQAAVAGWLLLLSLPGLRLLWHNLETKSYRQTVTPWLLAMLCLVAWVL